MSTSIDHQQIIAEERANTHRAFATVGNDYGDLSERNCCSCQHCLTTPSDIFGPTETCELGHETWEPPCSSHMPCQYPGIPPRAHQRIFNPSQSNDNNS